MPASVKLRLGNLFDGVSDLIALPCSTGGSVTEFVAKSLHYYKLPTPKPGMKLGDIQIVPFSGGENIAQYVAFAVSVSGMTSSVVAIRRIGKQLGGFTIKHESVREVAVPLLGAGAGGLSSESVVEALKEGFLETAADGATLTVSVLHRVVLDRLKGLKSEKPVIPNKRIRVFVSYTATSASHQKWVENLAKFLRANGVEARLDQWHLRKGMDLPQWMCNELKLAEKVVIVSDEVYAQRADGRLGGVGWETMLIQGDLSNLPPETTKYIVIVRSNEFKNGIPMYLKTKYGMHWTDTHKDSLRRNELLKELFDVSSEPEIGEPPVFLS